MTYEEQKEYVNSWLASRRKDSCGECHEGVVTLDWLSVVTFAPCPNCGGSDNGNNTGRREIHVVKERIEAF